MWKNILSRKANIHRQLLISSYGVWRWKKSVSVKILNILAGPFAKKRILPKGLVENVFSVAKILRLKILKNLTPTHRKFWYDENSTFSKITEISSKFLHIDEFPNLSLKMTKQEKTDFVREELSKLNKRLPSHIYLPTNPDTKIIDILPNSAFSLQSAKKVPFIVSFIGQLYEGPDSDYIVKHMNLSEYVTSEIAAYEDSLRVGVVQQTVYDVNGLLNSRILNRSTAQSVVVQNEERHYQHNNEITEPNQILFTNDLLSFDDEPIMNEDGDNLQDLTIPHIDIKVFSRTAERTRISSEQVGDAEIPVNINDLSDCTIDEIEDEEIAGENTSKN